MRRHEASLPALSFGLFLVSGAVALVYQVLWFKRFAHAWGNSSLAMTAVLAGFLLGLGLGAWTLGRLADRIRRPLLGYAVLEAGIALYALAFGAVLGLAERGVLALYPVLVGQPVLQGLVRLLVAFAVLAPPCAMMGATLPMLVRALAGPLRGLGVSTSWMYAANTGGAALGCYAAGFYLLPGLGLERTLHLVVAINLLVALVAALAGRRAFAAGWAGDSVPAPAAMGTAPAAMGTAPAAVGTAPAVIGTAPAAMGTAPAAEPARVAGVPERPQMPARALGLAALASGAAALVLQIAWARQLALVLGGTTYAFTAMLFVVLLGIGIGSLLAPPLMARVRDPLPLALGACLGISATALLGQAALPALAELVGAAHTLRASATVNALLCSGVSAVLELLPSLGAGLLFPVLVQASGAAHGTAGRAVGRIYAWNTLGTTLGAVLAHALLVPRLSPGGAVLVAVALYLFLGALFAQGRPLRVRLAARATAALALLAAFAVAPHHDPRLLERGLYLYGLAARDVFADAEVLFHRSGASANVLVTRHGEHLSLRVNGKVDASTFETDQRTQLGTAYMPRFLHPGARRVLVIGHGSGATSGASLLFADTEVTSVEIEPAVVQASLLFGSINHSPHDSPGFRLLVEDGRAHLAGTRERYDLILTEPSNPWIAGIANLFTREFYALAKERLAAGGILGQWIQTYALSEREYVSVAQTILEVFEHAALLRLTTGDTMLLASDRALVPSDPEIARAQAQVRAQPRVRADLRGTFGTDDVRALILGHLLLDDAGVRALAASEPRASVLTDADLRLEFDAPRHLFRAPGPEPGAALEAAILAHLDPGAYVALSRSLGAGSAQADTVVDVAMLLRRRGLEGPAVALLQHALELDPGSPAALAGLLVLAPEQDLEARLGQLAALSPRLAHAAARDLLARGRPEPALAIVEHLLLELEGSATLHRTRAALLERLGRPEEAAAAAERARELDPLTDAPLPAPARRP